MTSPFPGMDPYLEHREHWRGFHHHLAEEMLKQLNPRIVPKYYAEVEVHTVLEEMGISKVNPIYPDVVVLHTSLKEPAPVPIVTSEVPIRRPVLIPGQTKLRAVHVYVTQTKQLVTSIEILSPVNKYGDGLRKYRQKRLRILRSDVHLIEIDLLRSGERPGWELNEEPPIDTDYVVLVNRASDGIRRLSDIWPIALNASLPTIPVPLLEPDPDVSLDLEATFKNIYEESYYALRIDYDQPVPPPALRPPMQTWLTAQAKE